MTSNINVQLLEIVSLLPSSEQKKVLNFAVYLHKKQKFQQWDSISKEEAAKLKSEYGDEDKNFAEGILSDYLVRLDSEN